MRYHRTQGHMDLGVWKLARAMASEIYRVTAQLPIEERFGLQSQMRRAAVSVVSNLAEGAARETPADFRRFVGVSLGSLAELETQYLPYEDLGFLRNDVDFLRKIRRIRIMLASLRRALR